MVRCPKCNGMSIAGPSYVKLRGLERLRYACLTCGYSCTTPTRDIRSEPPLVLPYKVGDDL